MKKAKLHYYQEIENLLHKSPKPICVAFAVHCARDQLHNITDKSHYSICSETLNITEKYMKKLASKAELENAVKASASYAAAYAADAYAAAYNAAKDKDKNIKFKEYYEVLLSMLDKLSKLEKLVYEI